MKESLFTNAARIRSTQKVLQTHQAIAVMLEKGEMINYYSVAKSADVSRQFLYKHPDLRQLIDDCRVTGMSKKELQEEIIRLRLRIRTMEMQLKQISN